MNILSALVFIVLTFTFVEADSDKPCSALYIEGQSVVCRCNSTYCDTVTRDVPKSGMFVAYTSNEAGSRFKKSFGKLNLASKNGSPTPTLELDPSVLYQTIEGFGGAVTDSAGINWMSLRDPLLRQHLINSYFSKYGLEYNMIRVPIGGTDFSTRPYSYNDVPVDDVKLTGFQLAPEDIELKIPMIKAGMEVSTSTIHILGSLWSPPTWMKTVDSFIRGHLKKEHYQTLADYFVKFLDQYEEHGVSVWGVTLSNEPFSTIMVNSNISRLDWTAYDMGNWLVNNLGPTIRNSSYKHIKLIGGDDQRPSLPFLFNSLLIAYPEAINYLDGMAVHFYFDEHSPAEQLTVPFKDYPDVFVIATEACAGFKATTKEKVLLGSWERAELYASNIMEDLNYNVTGWIDWNMALNATGGPTWIGNNVDSPVIIAADNEEFYKQPMFYAMGHFSKFIPRGSRRIKVNQINSSGVGNVAFLTPNNTLVVILVNKGENADIILKIGSQLLTINTESKSITTVEFLYKTI